MACEPTPLTRLHCRLVLQRIIAPAGIVVMDQQDMPIQLFRAFDAVDYAFGFDKGENPDIAWCLSFDGRYAVTRVTPFENLQVAGRQRQ